MSAIFESTFSDGISLIRNIRSYLLNVSGLNFICGANDSFWSNRPVFGFMAHMIGHLVHNVLLIPALLIYILFDANDVFNCEIWSELILSSSSIIATDLSASTNAPASSVHLPPEKSSFTTAAVNPAFVDPSPVANWDCGIICFRAVSNVDFAVDGSPHINRFVYPLWSVPSAFILFSPETDDTKIASFISS